MGVSAAALRAGEATIELSLLAGKALGAQLSAVRSRIQGAFKGMTGVIGSAGGGLAGLGGTVGGIFKSGLIAGISGSFASLTANAGRLRNSLSQINALRFSGLLNLRNLLIGGIAGASLIWPIKLAANIEVATAQMAVFTGSAASARAMLLELQKFSAVAVVPFENLTRTAALLLRYGQTAAEAVANTKALAVIAAGDADEFDKLALAFAQVGSAGRLQGEEMRQFKNTGFNPLREIAQRTGETMDQVKKRMEAGNVSFKEVASALQAAVGPGGRFNGLLEAISNTLYGQLRQAFAGLMLAVLPLGEQMLKPLTMFMRAVNGAMPAIQKFVAANKEIYKTVLKWAFGIGAALVSLTALTVVVSLTAFLFSGLIAVVTGSIAALMLLLNPITLLTIGVGFLIYKFTQLPNVVGNAVANLGVWFGQLQQIAKDTFSGISDALTAGDIQMAADILWAGLKLAWLRGTDSLRQTWLSFKDIFMRTTLDITFGAMKAWTDFSNAISEIFILLKNKTMNMAMDIVITLGKIGKSDAQKKDMDAYAAAIKSVNDHTAMVELNDAREAGKKALADLAAAQATANAQQDKASNDAVNNARKDLKDAEAKLALLRLRAALEKAFTPDDKKWFGDNGGFVSDFADGIKKAKDTAKPIATFDTRLAREIFGATNDEIEKEQLKVQKRIEANTRKRAGLPVI